jgi:hypothetical protein
MRPVARIESVYMDAEKSTRFEPTYFLVYDRSTETECNRLVRVMPFNWIIWAINNEIYIIESTGATLCPPGTTPAIQVTSDIYSMTSTCITVLFQSILNLYPNEPRKIFYDVTESAVQDKFTILDALNILFIDLLTIKFDVDDIPMTNQLTFLNTHQETKDMSDTINVMKNRYQVLKPYHLDVLLQKVTVSMVNKDP